MSDLDELLSLRESVRGEILDYPLLLDALRQYASPRNIISRWIHRGYIIQLKKGLYVFGNRFRKGLIHLEVVANQLFGPSYVSCEYALQYHGLIPEAVHEVTCVTTKRNKMFETPMGRFSYRHLKESRYPTGIAWECLSDGVHALIATKEKALADMLFFKKIKSKNAQELLKLIIESYRIDEDELSQMDVMLMLEIAQHYRHPTISQLPLVLKEVKHAS